MDVIERMRERGRIRWGIVGCGDVTEVKSGPPLARIPGSALAAVMRRDGERARDYAQRHGVPRWTTDPAELIEADDVDAVYVATPPASHLGYVLQAAAAGKPVYVEKPMALDAREGEAMVAACRDAGVPLFVAYYRRALPRFEHVRELVQGGAVGTPSAVIARLATLPPAEPGRAGWRWDPDIGGEGLLLDLGSHGLDLLDHWLGPVERVHGERATRLPWSSVPDAVAATLRFPGEVLASAMWDFAAPRAVDEVIVVGSEGEVQVALFADGPVRTRARGRDRIDEIPHPAHVQEPLLQRIVDELLGRGGPAPSTGESALRTQAVLDALVPRSGGAGDVVD
jgi:1,5-anhydro-D-fructose reductase (1,5-anhydro-D-mannitol-forming)